MKQEIITELTSCDFCNCVIKLDSDNYRLTLDDTVGGSEGCTGEIIRIDLCENCYGKLFLNGVIPFIQKINPKFDVNKNTEHF